MYGERNYIKKPPVDSPPEVQKFYQPNVESRLGDFDIHCVHSFFATLGVEGHLITLTDVVNQTGDVYKNFFFGRIVDNKPKSLGLVEEFYDTTVH